MVMPVKPTRPRLSPSERAERCAAHRESTSPTDAKAFRLMAEMVHTLEDLTSQVDAITQTLAQVLSALEVNARAIADIRARIG